MGKLKAYIVRDKWNDAGSIVVWAETPGKAKVTPYIMMFLTVISIPN